jgi:hypothetical protein
MRSLGKGDLGFVHRLEQYCHIAALMAIRVFVALRSFVSDASDVGLEHAVKLGEWHRGHQATALRKPEQRGDISKARRTSSPPQRVE